MEPVEWREAMTDKAEKYDIAFIEGSITRPQDEEMLKDIREKSKMLVSLGACATIGGVNKLKNNFELYVFYENIQKGGMIFETT